MPQKPPDYDALARRFNGQQAVDYDAIAQQTPTQPPQQAVNGLQGVPDVRSLPGQLVEGAARVLIPSTTPSDYLEGPMYAASHPLDSLKLLLGSITDATMGQAGKSREAIEASMKPGSTTDRLGSASRAVGHAAATAVPVLGPAVAHAGELIGEGDPSGYGEALGLLAPTLLPKAAGLARPGVAAVAEKAGAVTEGLRGKAADMAARGVERRIVDVAAPKTGQNKIRFGKQVADIAPTLAREPGLGAASREGLAAKVDANLSAAEAALDDATNARVSARTFATKPILEALREKRRRLTSEAVEASDLEQKPTGPPTTRTDMGVPGGGRPATRAVATQGQPLGQDIIPGPNAARVAMLDQAIREIEQLGPQARYEPLRRIREAYDGPAKVVYNPSLTGDFLKAQGGKLGAADITGVLREKLAEFDPETATANAEYSLYRKASDVLEAAKETEQVRPNLFRKTMGRIGGVATGAAVGGGEGAVAGLITAEFLDRIAASGVTTKVYTARLLATLEDALRGKRQTQVQSVIAKLQRVASTASTTSVATGRMQTGAMPAGR